MIKTKCLSDYFCSEVNSTRLFRTFDTAIYLFGGILPITAGIFS